MKTKLLRPKHAFSINPILISLSILIFASLFQISACHRDDDTTIKVTGIEFVPNCFLSNGVMVGMDTDIADTALQMAGIVMEKGITESWDEAFNATLEGPNRALLTVGYSAERKDLFKWAGPTSQGMYGIFARDNFDLIFPITIEASKKLKSIAVVKNWLETITLEDLGFENLTYYDTYDAALAAFMNKDQEFIASDFFHLVKALPEGYYMQEVHAITRYRTVFYYIAFSKDVADAVVDKVQNSIESLIEDQTTVSILRGYFETMPAEYIPGTIQLFTEFAPPYNYYTGRATEMKIVGSAVDIVNEIQTRSGFVNKINISTWTDAYAPPQYLPNSAVFTTARSAARESKFQWVGPISANHTFFYTLANSGLTIQTLDQARALKSVGTPKEWYTHDFLVANSFKNIVTTAITSQDAFEQLINGEVEALLLTDVDVAWLAKENGVVMSDLTQQMEALNLDGYIAFSLNTSAKLIQEWQTNLDAMKADGTFDAIWKKWTGR